MLIQSNAFLVAMRRCNRDFVNNSTVQVQEKISMHRSNSLAGKKREKEKEKTYEENNVQSIIYRHRSVNRQEEIAKNRLKKHVGQKHECDERSSFTE